MTPNACYRAHGAEVKKTHGESLIHLGGAAAKPLPTLEKPGPKQLRQSAQPLHLCPNPRGREARRRTSTPPCDERLVAIRITEGDASVRKEPPTVVDVAVVEIDDPVVPKKPWKNSILVVKCHNGDLGKTKPAREFAHAFFCPRASERVRSTRHKAARSRGSTKRARRGSVTRGGLPQCVSATGAARPPPRAGEEAQSSRSRCWERCSVIAGRPRQVRQALPWSGPLYFS